MRISYAVAAIAVVCAPGAAYADDLTYNGTPAATYYFGNNTNYTPANSAVLTTGNDAQLDAGEDQVFARFHVRYPNSQFAPMSTGNTYDFQLGTNAPSFDYGLTSANGFTGVTGLITVTNLGTGVSKTYDPFDPLLGNSVRGNTFENSENLSFGFIDVGFDNNNPNTYRVTFAYDGLASGFKSLTINARYTADGVAPVPEPATWMMMLLGFGMVAGVARHARRKVKVSFA